MSRPAPRKLDQRIQTDEPASLYDAFYAAYNHFNAALFGDTLPSALITLQRKRGARGYFSPQRFERRPGEGRTDEIALNPNEFSERTDREIISTLVHEMVHLKQEHFGNPGRGRYHNKEWARWMLEIGLHPTDSGEIGGKMTGDHVTHVIVASGPYDLAWHALEQTGFVLGYQDRDAIARRIVTPSYRCPLCNISVRGKPDLILFCKGQDDDAHVLMQLVARAE